VQVIIPLAGKGTRLRPHTHLIPKPMLKVAGRPVIDWVMDTLKPLDVTELIFITGHLKDQVEEYATGRYGIPCRYIEQKVQDGTAGAVNLARAHVTGPVLIVFVGWDLYAVAHGHWAFDAQQTLGLRLPGGLPAEELAFFVVVPVCAVLALEAVRRATGWRVGDER